MITEDDDATATLDGLLKERDRIQRNSRLISRAAPFARNDYLREGLEIITPRIVEALNR